MKRVVIDNKRWQSTIQSSLVRSQSAPFSSFLDFKALFYSFLLFFCSFQPLSAPVGLSALYFPFLIFLALFSSLSAFSALFSSFPFFSAPFRFSALYCSFLLFLAIFNSLCFFSSFLLLPALICSRNGSATRPYSLCSTVSIRRLFSLQLFPKNTGSRYGVLAIQPFTP